MTTIGIILGGDILPVRSLASPPASAERVYELIRSADLALGNFEMPLTDRGTPVQKLLNIRAPASIALGVPVLGFDVLTIANNHAVDCGWEGLVDTREGLQAGGIAVIGIGETRDLAAGPLVREVAGLRIGIVAFSCLTPPGTSAGPDRPGISPIHIVTAYEVDPWYQMEEPGDPSVVRVRTAVRPDDLDWAGGLVSRTKAECDLVIVTIHWGFGSGETLADYQMPLARALVEAGADVVHGHHPHAIHGIGFHRGKPIFFSAGTFIGQQVFLDASPQVKDLWAAMSADGYVAMLSINAQAIAEIRLHPTTLDDNRLPILAEGPAAERIGERIARLSAPLGATVSLSNGVFLVRAID